jgi:HEAT repeat protein
MMMRGYHMPEHRKRTSVARRALRAAIIIAMTVTLAGMGAAQQAKTAGAPGTGAAEKSHAAAKAATLPQASAKDVPKEKKAPAPPASNAKEKDAGAVKSPGEDAVNKAEADRKKREEDKKKKDEDRDRKQVEWIEKTLEFGIQQDRMEAMNMILRVRNNAEKERLGRILRQSVKEEIDIEVKSKAINILGEIKLREALPELTASLEDESQDVKIAAVYAMKRIDDKSVAGRLSDELKKQDMKKQSNYTEAIIDALGSFKVKELKDFAVGEIKKDSTDASIRQNLVLFLGRVEATDARDFLLGLAKDDAEDNMIRAYAVNSLARMGLRDTGPEIDKILKEIDSYPFKKRQKYYKLYIYSIAALAKLGDKSVYPRLVNAIRSNNEQVRLQAVKLIKEINEKRTIDILKYKMKHDPSTKVQRAAREALQELGVPVEEDKQKKDPAPARKEGKEGK